MSNSGTKPTAVTPEEYMTARQTARQQQLEEALQDTIKRTERAQMQRDHPWLDSLEALQKMYSGELKPPHASNCYECELARLRFQRAFFQSAVDGKNPQLQEELRSGHYAPGAAEILVRHTERKIQETLSAYSHSKVSKAWRS